MQTVIESVSQAEKLKFVKAYFNAAKELGHSRSFMELTRNELGLDWFSKRGIEEHKRMRFESYLENAAFNPYNEKNIFAGIEEAGINRYVEKLARLTKDAETAYPAFFTEVINRANGSPIAASVRGVEIPRQEPKPEPQTADAPKAEIPAQQGLTVRPAQAPEVVKAQPAKVEMKKEQATASFNLMLPLTDMINAAVHDYIENTSGLLAHIDKRIEQEAMKLRPNQIYIPDAKPVEIKGRLHKAFQDTLLLARLEKQVFITGPAGTGKTTLAEQVAKALQLPFGFISCTAGMSEAHLLGRMDAHGNYLKSEFVELYENGGVFLFDEVDAADSNTMLIINSALANGHLSVPNRKDKPRAQRHPNFYCICAANTWGYGSNEYAGRNVLDAAFLDRFAGSRLTVDYDQELEKEMSAAQPQVAEAIWKIRENVAKNRMRRVVSSRAILAGVRQVSAGVSLKAFVERFLTGWTDEEKKKALDGVKL